MAAASGPGSLLRLRNSPPSVAVDRKQSDGQTNLLIQNQQAVLPLSRLGKKSSRTYAVRRSDVNANEFFGSRLTKLGSALSSNQHRLSWHSDGPGHVPTLRVMVRFAMSQVPEKPLGLYDPKNDKDACGVGFVDELSGKVNRKTIARRRGSHLLKYIDAQVISLGIGDTTEPIPDVIIAAMAEPLRAALASTFYINLGIEKGDIFVSDGAKCDISRLQVLFGSQVTVTVQDPSYLSNTAKLLFSFNVGLLGLIVLLTTFITHGTRRETVVGLICAICSVCVFASPLSVIRTVIATKAVADLHLWCISFPQNKTHGV